MRSRPAQSPVPVLVAANPHATYARVATLLHPDPPLESRRASGSDCRGRGAHVDAIRADIARRPLSGEGARIGARCFIGPGCVIERGRRRSATIRASSRACSSGTTWSSGARCIVQPGAVIGGDGFGFAPEKGTWVKVPQIGGVIIGDDVEIGANTTIDRGALGDTVIEEGVKIDNLIMIAHNVRIGAHSALAACSRRSPAAAWSASAASWAAGRASTGHITLCDDVVVLGTSFISHSIDKPGVYSSALPSEEAGVVAAHRRRASSGSTRWPSDCARSRNTSGFSAVDKDSSEE